MRHSSSSVITQIRSASRDLVRELGFMSKTLAGTDLSPSAVHAIIEIRAADNLSSKALSEKLLLEKSTVSRLIKSLIAKGETRHSRSDEDGRLKNLTLTDQGEKTATAIIKFAQMQVAAAIDPLNDQTRRDILIGLGAYSAALKASRKSVDTSLDETPIRYGQGYTPCLIGAIIDMHASYYSKLVGFGAAFEAQVACGLANFISRRENPLNAVWFAEQDARIVASIVIDGEDLADRQAHLRWFIVDDSARGAGVGRTLLQRTLTFCDDRNFSETHLWTFKGLDAARGLYEMHGFHLVEERHGGQWGTQVLEQKFIRLRPS